ncbi:hypothetical protein ABPG75_003427 [Micractinium tetrahymenae]
MQHSALLGTPLRAPATGVARPSVGRTCTPQALFGFTAKPKAAPKRAAKRETIVVKPSFTIPTVLLGTAAAAHFAHLPDAASWVPGVLGAFLAFQANRVRFVFDDEALEVVVGPGKQKSENAFVGGENRWAYSTFVNWEYWWPSFPVLVYFKETQTKPEGQIHFFPIIMDGKQLYDVMVERCGPSQNSGPK